MTECAKCGEELRADGVVMHPLDKTDVTQAGMFKRHSNVFGEIWCKECFKEWLGK